MKHLFFAKLLLLSTISLAQTGNYFLSHISPDNKRFDNVCFDIVQDQRGVLYFASQAGILEYDGTNWDVLPGNGAVYSLQIGKGGMLFWSGAKGYGEVRFNNSGREELQRLSDSTVTDVFQTLVQEDAQYFLNENAIFIRDGESGKTFSISSYDQTGTFVGIFELSGKIYVNTDLGKTFLIHEKDLVAASLGFPEGVTVSNCIRHNDDYVLITNTNRMYLARENQRLHEVLLEDQAYADASVMVTASWVNPQLVSVGTLRGGVIFVDPTNGKTQEIVNYNTGLPDNEVFALMRDRNQSVWVAHDYGFTRISPYLPFRSFSHFAGLSGNLLCARSFQNSVYVGTSLGLFRLEKEDLYDELIYFVDIEVKPKKSSKAVKETKPVVQEPVVIPQQTETESKRRGLFRFLRKKKDKADPVVAESTKTETPAENKAVPAAESNPTKPVFRREQRTKKILRSSQYVYKKIEGIESKVSQLIEVDGRLIAAGLAGAYEVKDREARAVLHDPVRFIYAPPGEEFLIASTYDDEIWSLSLSESQQWESLPLLNDIDYEINFMFAGPGHEIWMCSHDKIYRVELSKGEVTSMLSVALPSSNPEETIGIPLKDEILFASTAGFFRFDRARKSLVQVDSMRAPQVYFANERTLWFREGHDWNTAGDASRQNNLHLLNLFTDLRFISSDQSPENLWLVSGNNELYKFYGERFTPYDAGYDLFVKSVRIGEKPVRNLKDIEITENIDVVSFAIVQPDYVNSKAMEYRYFLKGLHQEWTEWSTANNQLDFPYLPPGDYALQVQSRNIFGKVEEMNPLSFEVLPPYWKRSWFYALEFFVFAGLVVLSFRLSTRYRFISRLLSLLTIILLIQFIQTVIGATFSAKDSPVTDFFIQVIVALLILPVEGYLRKLMLRSIDTSGKFHTLITRPLKSGPEEAEKN